MRVLLIAPDNPDLKSIDATVAAISRYLEVTPLVGNVREVDIQREVAKGPYDVIWFVTHGGAAGMALSGAILPPEGVGQYTEASGAKLCVMSTCDSEDVANRIVAGGDADMVCTISSDVDDADAARFDALFAQRLADLPDSDEPDFEKAFEAARGKGATKYRYIRAKAALRGLAVAANDGLGRLEDKVDIINSTINKIEITLATHTARLDQMTAQSLLSEQRTIQAQARADQVADLDRGRVERQLPPPAAPVMSFPPLFWAILVLIVLLLLAAVYFR